MRRQAEIALGKAEPPCIWRDQALKEIDIFRKL